MANICAYKIKVTGNLENCWNFFASQAAYNDKYVCEEENNDDSTTLIIKGDCKNSVDSRCQIYRGKTPIAIEELTEEMYEKVESKYGHYKLRSRSKMFDVEVWCVSGDIGDIIGEEGPLTEYVHYKNGFEVMDSQPDNLKLDRDQWDW